MDKLMALEFAPAEVDVERLHGGGGVYRVAHMKKSYPSVK